MLTLPRLILSILIFIGLISIFYFSTYPRPYATHQLISLFPIQHYDQKITDWIKPSEVNYDKPLLTQNQQNIRKEEWFDHYYGQHSPWNGNYIQHGFATTSTTDLKTGIQKKITFYSNKKQLDDAIGYGANFRPYSEEWLSNLERNMNLKQFDLIHYHSSNRAIATNNISGRQLPTEEVHFYHHQLAGQGYPFDNLEAAVIWAGTPLYVLGETRDQDWSLVLSPSFIAWVKNTDIARVNDAFIKTWESNAKLNLIAVIKTHIPIKDSENDLYRFTGYIGMVFPGKNEKDKLQILIPVSDDQRHAHIHHAMLSKQQASIFPLLPTPRHFITILSELIGRPYGWGGMYFYNDCASELKNLYTPFGIWLPIHSSNQVKQEDYLIKTVDLSHANSDTRLDYLVNHGHPFMTIVHIGGHVFLYVGNYADPHDPSHKRVPLSYQNMWGLKPKNATLAEDRRAVIGSAVLFPILKKYPEDTSLSSPADKKYFQIAYLDEFPENLPLASREISIDTLLSP